MEHGPNGVGHLLRCLHRFGGNVDHAGQNIFSAQQFEEFERHIGIRDFNRHLINRRVGQQGERLLILTPLVSEALLPLDVGLHAVSVADVDRGGDPQSIDRSL